MTTKILVVDDSITIRKIVAMAFENEDVSVEGIGDGDEGLIRLESFQPDVVLADVDMPGLNGFELSREIKESSEFKSIPVLLLASDFEEFDENLFRASLADGHITKPFKSEDLVHKVTDLLNGSAQTAANEEDEEEVIELSTADRLDEETEEVIELSSTDRLNEATEEVIELTSSNPLDEDIVLELGEDHIMGSLEGLSSEEQDDNPAPPHNHELTGLDGREDAGQDEIFSEVEPESLVSDSHPEKNPPVAHTADDPSKKAMTDPEESLDDLLKKVAELSKKSEELSHKGSREELSPMEAIDVMLKEVSALKDESFSAAPKDENSFSENTERQSSSDPNGNETVLAEVDYVSEENAGALAVAFDDILNGNQFSAPGKTKESSGHQESLSQSEENIDNLDEMQLLKDGQLTQLMEIEVKRILQQSLTALIEKELSGLSEKILRSVEENVRKITPGIAQAIIEKEIDKIKTMEDG